MKLFDEHIAGIFYNDWAISSVEFKRHFTILRETSLYRFRVLEDIWLTIATLLVAKVPDHGGKTTQIDCILGTSDNTVMKSLP